MRIVRGVEIPDGEPFTEDFSYVRGQNLHFEAASFKRWQETVFPGSTKKGFGVSIGNGFVFQSKQLPVVVPRWSGWMFDYRRNGWQRSRIEMPGHGSVSFDSTVRVVQLVHFVTGGPHEPRVWMSLTPGEIYSQRAGVKRGKGNVLILGLGMGWMAQRVLEREKVKHVTIVERELPILEHFGLMLKEEFGNKVTLVHGDAHKYGDPRINKQYDYDIALWDIWSGYSGCAYDRKYCEIVDIAKCWQWGTMSR